jgi:hypothetical protein
MRPVRSTRILCAFALALVAAAAPVASEIPSPEAHFGFRMGADRMLASADAIERYFELVAAASDRVELADLGRTTEGHRTMAAIVSSPGNIASLDRIRADNRRLADPRTLPPEDARKLAEHHKAVVVIGGAIHASEVGATQTANELLYTLATSPDPGTLELLDQMVLILIPSLNPDGHRLVVDWYEQQKGTPFEGGPMPWLYHKYAGHDINRDAFMMNLAENRNLARFFYTQWHPQVFLTMHQMASDGPRFFVPPGTDPIHPNYDPMIWRTAALLGSAMALELQRDGRSGVLSNAMYDYYWPGYEDSAPLGHNVVCLLTEAAGVKVATPLALSAGELRGGQRGFADYQAQMNFPDPWPGGSWTLRDVVDYELSAVNGLLRGVAAYRQTIVENFYEMGRRAVEAGRRGGPFAFLVPPEQRDPHAAARLEQLLLDGAVEIHRALEPFRADGDPYPAGTDIILMAQPYRAYVKTLLEVQRYPMRREADLDTSDRPYDVVGWTLHYQMGVDVRTIERYFQVPAMSRLDAATIAPASVWGERRPDYYVIDARGNAGAIAANRLAAARLEPAWITAPLDAGGYRYEAGSLVISHSRSAEAVVTDIAGQLGLRVDGVRGRMPEASPVARGRVALYRPWVETIDEGWTRWVLEHYEFPFEPLDDVTARQGNLRARFDAVILPSAPPDRLRAGYVSSVVPAEYAGGLSQQGLAALRRFVEEGGTLVLLDDAGGLGISLFNLPLRDVARDDDRLFCPGSILRIELDPAEPLAFGMPAETAGFFSFSSAYELLDRRAATPRGSRFSQADAIRTIASYATKELLLSGWLEGEEVLAGRAAVIEASVGAGRVVLLGFRAQHRAQSLASFRLLFNALLTAG